jgi:hypothetical protein
MRSMWSLWPMYDYFLTENRMRLLAKRTRYNNILMSLRIKQRARTWFSNLQLWKLSRGGEGLVSSHTQYFQPVEEMYCQTEDNVSVRSWRTVRTVDRRNDTGLAWKWFLYQNHKRYSMSHSIMGHTYNTSLSIYTFCIYVKRACKMRW